MKEQYVQGYYLLFNLQDNIDSDKEEDKQKESEIFKDTEKEKDNKSQEHIRDSKYFNNIKEKIQDKDKPTDNPKQEDQEPKEIVNMVGYSGKDDIPTIDILKENGTCIQVTVLDSYGEDEERGAPEGSNKEYIIDETMYLLK